jgi:hypothetical protein
MVASEYFKAIFVKRRWPLLTLPPILVSVVEWLVNHFSQLPGDIREASRWSPPWWAWALSILFCFGIAQFLAWHEKHNELQNAMDSNIRTVQDLRSDVSLRQSLFDAERARSEDLSRKLLDNGPRITLRWVKLMDDTMGSLSIGADKKVCGLSISPLNRDNLRLTFDDIDSLNPDGPPRPLEMCLWKGDELERPGGSFIFHMFGDPLRRST